MGMFGGRFRSGHEVGGNPNPHRFRVLEVQKCGKAVVVKVNYPDCLNYEGNKILVFDSYDKFDILRTCGTLDPHFVADENSPVARFEPTLRGWQLATQVANSLG